MLTPIINFFKKILNKEPEKTVITVTEVVTPLVTVKSKKPRKPRIKKATK